jgi:ABC-type sugar transport system ATPase subunit
VSTGGIPNTGDDRDPPVRLSDAPALAAVGLCKSYGPVRALDGASVTLRAGEITSLVGQNGSGKSTLVRVITGDTRADAGEVLMSGRPLHLHSTRRAAALGISIAFQELSLVPDLSVAENLLIGAEPLLAGVVVDKRKLKRLAEGLLEDLEVPARFDVSLPVGELPLAEQQLVELARVLARRPPIAVFDEPTAALGETAVKWLFARMSELADSGSAVLFISHRLREVYEISQRIVVLRNGRDVLSASKADVSESELVQSMLGQRLLQEFEGASLPAVGKEPLLELEGVHLSRGKGSIDLRVREGEILGLGGLQGQGQRELLRGLAGRETFAGTVRLAGKRLQARSPTYAIQQGICLIPEDRRTEGLLSGRSIRENLFVGVMRRGSAETRGRGDRTSHRGELLEARSLMRRFGIRATSQEVEVGTLSGGNQQKVLIARSLAKKPKVLLLADITRGVDVGTKADIFATLRELAREGVAIVLYSTDATELVANCHRVAVMYDYRIQALLEKSDLTEENIARAAVGIEERPNSEAAAR